jgi:glycosyltransferase involved in cell wall biosynthesis
VQAGRLGDVTVVITCFNYGRYLPEAVQSALGQEAGSPRIIVVDDGSTEPETLKALDQLPSGIDLVRQPRTGVSVARNVGLARVQTPYAFVVDADDRLTPNALEVLRCPLEQDQGLGFAYGRMRFFGDWEGELRFPPYDPYALLYRHTIGLSALMRREVVETTGGFDPAFEEFEDWELWVNALAHGWRGVQVDAVTVEYRRHRGSKQAADRHRYRQMFGALRRKHSSVYAKRNELAAESALGPFGRLVYRVYWGPRPLPSAVEAFLYRLRWGRGVPTGD